MQQHLFDTYGIVVSPDAIAVVRHSVVSILTRLLITFNVFDCRQAPGQGDNCINAAAFRSVRVISNGRVRYSFVLAFGFDALSAFM